MRPITAFISDISKASGKAKALLKARSRAEGVTARIGIALYPNDGGTFEELYDHADVAMYRAKALEVGTVMSFIAGQKIGQAHIRRRRSSLFLSSPDTPSPTGR